MEDKNKKVLDRINESLSKLKNKDFNVYFFVMDSKGVPNGKTQYIYEIAKELENLKYNVAMLHVEEDFIGVKDSMGEEYSNLTHYCVKNVNVSITERDFLIIPEVFSNVMRETKDLPCKRIILCQNINYITEFIPLGVSWKTYNIFDVITTSENQAIEIHSLFPETNIEILEPSIPHYFRSTDEPKKLMVSVITKEQSIFNRIVKQFHLKFPQYRWVTFTDLRGLEREQFSDVLRESEIAVWVDDETYFGYSAVEAIKSGCITIGKVPDVIPDWMYNADKTGLNNAGVWFNDLRDVQRVIASVVKAIMDDNVPEDILEDMKIVQQKFTPENRRENLKNLFNKYVEDRISEIENIKNKIIDKKEEK